MANDHFHTQDIPAPSDLERAALAQQCHCTGCANFRNALEDVIVAASQSGMSAPRLAMNVASVVGASIGQLAITNHASDFVDELAARMKPFAEMANRAAQAADLREEASRATRQ